MPALLRKTSGLVAFPLLLVCFAVLVLISASGSVKEVLLQVKVTRAIQDRSDIERWVRVGLSCPLTVAALPGGICPAGEIDLYRQESSSPIMVKKDAPFTQVGLYIVKARCTGAAPKTIELFVERVGTGEVRKVKMSYPLTCT